MPAAPPQLPIFADGKEPDALRTIGEVAAALGIRQHVLRYWEQQFPMLQPLKRSGARRYYRRADVELVSAIDRLINREGYPLKGARQALEKGLAQAKSARPEPVGSEAHPQAQRPSVSASSAPEDGSGAMTGSARTIVEFLPRLSAIRDRLAAALAA